MFSVFVAESWVGSGGDFRYYTSERDSTHRPVEAVGMRVWGLRSLEFCNMRDLPDPHIQDASSGAVAFGRFKAQFEVERIIGGRSTVALESETSHGQQMFFSSVMKFH